jgi:hypothetical protein
MAFTGIDCLVGDLIGRSELSFLVQLRVMIISAKIIPDLDSMDVILIIISAEIIQPFNIRFTLRSRKQTADPVQTRKNLPSPGIFQFWP